jgi:hypothetical protein
VPDGDCFTDASPGLDAGLTKRHEVAQPWAGLGGLLLAAVVFFALAVGTGTTTTSLLVLGPIATFALPAVAVVAFWWNDWPGSRLTTPWAGINNTVLVVGAAVVLTIVGEAVIERPDISALFEAHRAPGLPVTFPATLALAGASFVAMLQLTLICERWPLERIGRIRSGIVALALSWIVGATAYFLFVSVNYLPAIERAGLHKPAGPVARNAFGAALIAVGVWQAVIYIGLHGWPLSSISNRAARIIAGNVVVIVLGTLTYLALRDLQHWAPDAIGAACGCVISAVLVVSMLFDNWPSTTLRPAEGRALTLALTALLALAMNRALAAYADGVHWTRASPDDWITTASLSFIGAGIILHTGIGLRWPFIRGQTPASGVQQRSPSRGEAPTPSRQQPNRTRGGLR